MTNEKIMTVELTRLDVCDLLLACTAAKSLSNGAKKWDRLHEELKKQLEKFENENE